jgi:hypothetical protein
VVVLLEVAFDAVEHLAGDRLVGTDQHHELPVAVEHGPDAGPLRHRALARATGHGEGEQLAPQDGGLNLGDRREVVGAPRQRERLAGVGLAEAAKVSLATGPAGRVFRAWDRADVAAGRR